DASDRAEPRWILSGSRLWSRGEYLDHPLLEDLEGAEFQPGPAAWGDRLLVSARTLDGELRHHLLALDLATGEPLWSRLVAKGSEVSDQRGGRFSQGGFPLGAAPPLELVEGAVFVGTHLGVGALYDAVDGRLLWAFKNRRRAPGEPGWSGLRPLTSGPHDGQAPSIAWAPADSDFLYQLVAGPVTAAGLEAGSHPQVAAPLAVGEATDLVASDGATLLCFARAGAERCLTEIDPVRGTRSDSVYLRRGEVFVDLPAVGKQRVVAATNRGLFLFDRADELRLLDQLPLPFGRGPRAPGGHVASLGDRLLVLGPGTLWVLAPK
ncbi:MAG: hypothetical protein P1V81_18510, partial [Planctomycetota bacterium]|nr:hypothetical protein [Planctomycetota bacterium]